MGKPSQTYRQEYDGATPYATAEGAQGIGYEQDSKEELHKLFDYELHEKIHHFYQHVMRRLYVLKVLHKRLQDMAEKISAYDELVRASWSAYQRTGSPAEKKTAILASIEAKKLKLHFRYLLGVKHQIKKAMKAELKVAKSLSSY